MVKFLEYQGRSSDGYAAQKMTLTVLGDCKL